MSFSVIDQTMRPHLRKPSRPFTISFSKGGLFIGVHQSGLLIEFLRLLKSAKDLTFTNLLLSKVNTTCSVEIDLRKSTEEFTQSTSMEPPFGLPYLEVYSQENTMKESFQREADTITTRY